MHTRFTAAQIALATLWNQLRILSKDDGILKMWCIYTREIFSVIKNGIITSSGKWMELQTIVLKEIEVWLKKLNIFSQMQKLEKNKNYKRKGEPKKMKGEQWSKGRELKGREEGWESGWSVEWNWPNYAVTMYEYITMNATFIY